MSIKIPELILTLTWVASSLCCKVPSEECWGDKSSLSDLSSSPTLRTSSPTLSTPSPPSSLSAHYHPFREVVREQIWSALLFTFLLPVPILSIFYHFISFTIFFTLSVFNVFMPDVTSCIMSHSQPQPNPNPHLLHLRCLIFTSTIGFCSGSPWRVERTISTVIRNLKLAKVEIVRNLLRSPTPATFLSNLRNQSRLYKVQNICICFTFVNISYLCMMVMI